MRFFVAKGLSFRSLGLRKSTGKHAAPKGPVPQPRQSVEDSTTRRPAHAATMPRLTGSAGSSDAPDGESKAESDAA
jgi:hypothetical protein